MVGGTAGEIIASKAAGFEVGEYVVSAASGAASPSRWLRPR